MFSFRDRNLNLLSVLIFLLFSLREAREIYLQNPKYFSEVFYSLPNIVYQVSFVLAIFVFKKNSILLSVITLSFYSDIPIVLYKQISTFLFSVFFENLLVYKFVFITGVILFCTIPFLISYKTAKLFSLFIVFIYLYSIVGLIFASPKKSEVNIRPLYHVDSVSKDIFILLFDEYPSFNSYKIEFPERANLHIDSYLKKNNFKSCENCFSNYTETKSSVVSILTGKLYEKEVGVYSAIDVLSKNVFTNGKNYNFYSFSIFDDINRSNSFITTLFFRDVNSIGAKYFFPYILSFFSKRGFGLYTKYSNYHFELINQMEYLLKQKTKKIGFFHFFTPHDYPSLKHSDVISRLEDANYWIKRSIDQIQRINPEAGIVVLSDHGMRRNPFSKTDFNKILMYYSNLEIDIDPLLKTGVHSLFRNVDFEKN
jgi:hypothetical protein